MKQSVKKQSRNTKLLLFVDSAVGQTDLLVMKQFSLLEIISTGMQLAAHHVVVDLPESSMLLTQLHFQTPTGTHLLLVEC